MGNLSLSKKIMGNVIFLLILMAVSTTFGIVKMQGIGNELKDVAEQDMPLTKIISEIGNHQLEQSVWFERALRFGNVNRHEDEQAEALRQVEQEFDKISLLVDEQVKKAEKIAAEALNNAHSQEAQHEFVAVLAKLKKIEEEHLDYEKHADHIFEVINEGHIDQARKLAVEVEEEEEQLNKEMMEFVAHIEEFTQEALLTAEHDEETAIKGMILIGIFSLITGLGLGFFISRSITLPISKVVDNLASGSEQISDAAGQVSSASQSLAEGASEQASAIEETSASMEELSSMTRQNAENAKQADNLMKSSMEIITSADSSMREMNDSMEDIANASEATSKIVKTIDEIAFQTNLLALNAAVEAARAGEAGAGFAVVADEVRNLAMRAAEAAKTTSELIEGTVAKVNKGKEIVVKTNESFKEVSESSSKIGGIVAEIAEASSEQAHGLSQITTAITQMDTVTQQNSAAAEQSAAAAEELYAQSETMMDVLKELTFLVEGGKGSNQQLSAVKQKSFSVKSGKKPLLTLFSPKE